MTAAAALLALAEATGVTIEADGDRLRLRAASPPPAALLHDLADAKAEVLDLLVARQDEAQERAAIEAEPALPLPGSPERERLEARHQQVVAGIQGAAMQRPSSWAGADALPSPGCWCSCCRGRRWWREQKAPKGWRCRTCHPPPDGVPTAELST